MDNIFNWERNMVIGATRLAIMVYKKGVKIQVSVCAQIMFTVINFAKYVHIGS